MSGGFTHFAGGSVAIEIGGTAAGQFGRITINGSAALAGTLNLSAVNGFDPGLGSTFNVMTYTSHTGQFDTVNGSIGNGKQFAVDLWREWFDGEHRRRIPAAARAGKPVAHQVHHEGGR